MRTFIGIKIKDCLEDIIKIQKKFINQYVKANYTLANNIHITLSFLGEINNRQVDEVKKILDSIDFPPFIIKTSKLKNLRDMVIIELEENKDLLILQNKIENSLIEKGFNIEKRKYYPHITLMRKTDVDINIALNIKTNVDEIILFSSERINNVLTYTPIHRKNLR